MRLQLLLVAVLVMAAGIFAPAVDAREEAPVAQVLALSGEGTVVRPAESLPLAESMPLFRGDRIITRANARTQIRFEDGSTLVVGEQSEVIVRQYAEAGASRSTVLALVFGIVRATVPSEQGGGMEIWTNAAVAAVRHTDWIVIRRADRSAVFTVDGTVAVRALEAGRDYDLEAGNGIDILSDGEIVGPQEWGAPRVDAVLDATRAP